MGIIDNPSGALFLNSKNQFAAMCVALEKIEGMLDTLDEGSFDNGKLNIEIKAVTENCYRINVGGLLNISDDEIQTLMD